MKLSTKLVYSAFLSATLLFTGCNKKPVRPTPDLTMTGTDAGPGGITSDTFSQTVVPVPGGPEIRNPIQGEQVRGVLEPIYFDFDQATIKPSERVKLQAALKYLTEHPEYRLLLEGHCDWRGTPEYNLGLGDRRAAAAKKYLVSIKAMEADLDTLSKGDLDAVKNADAAQMLKDRRVDLVLIKK